MKKHSFKVCMVSHTKVNRDARLGREAQAVAEAGYETHLICLANLREPRLPAGLEEVTLHELADYSDVRVEFLNQIASVEVGRVRRLLAVLVFPPILIFLALLSCPPVRYSIFLLKGILLALWLRPNLVHCHDLNVLLIGAVMNLVRGSIVVYDSHEIFTEKVAAKKWKRIWAFLEKILLFRCRAVIVTTELRAKAFRDLYPDGPEPLVVHNYPSAATQGSRDIREVAGIPSDAFVALYQGGIQEHRGLELMVEVAQYLDDIYIVIQGDGPLSLKLRDLVEHSPKKDWIICLPGKPYHELRKFTASASVGFQLLQPFSINHTSTLSNKLFEYLHAGLPVVAADFPLIRNVVEGCDVGIVVDPTDTLEIASALRRLASDPGEKRRLSERALQAAGNYRWEDEKIILLRLYRQLAEAATDSQRRVRL